MSRARNYDGSDCHEEIGVRVCVYLFNGQRPVPITQVLNIPCWDKSRQVVKPGFHEEIGV